MNEQEIKEAKKLAIMAIEEYINNHDTELFNMTVAPMTSGYLVLDRFKDQLIREAYKN